MCMLSNGGSIMGEIKDDIKDKMKDIEHKAYELKGRAIQKKKDMSKKD